MMAQERRARIGIDWGGTKIEALAMDADGGEIRRVRIPTPRNDYERSVQATAELVASIEREVGTTGPIGVGIPGTIVPGTGLVKNANSTWLNGKPFEKDLSEAMGRAVRCVNDANCLAISEATDGAAMGYGVVFAAILGTGCGAGIAVQGRMHSGPNGVAGEWGHNPLPWQRPEEYPGEPCYCGQRGCIERWLCGPALEEDYRRASGRALSGAEIVAAAEAGEAQAAAAMERYEDRLARALAHVVNLLDPDIIVLGGGLSRIERLYRNVPPKIAGRAFGGSAITQMVAAKHGDSSGVRGAARLWVEPERTAERDR
jgi:fructokinase